MVLPGFPPKLCQFPPQIGIIIIVYKFIFLVKFPTDGNSHTVGEILAKLSQKYILRIQCIGASVRSLYGIRQNILQLSAIAQLAEAYGPQIFMHGSHLLPSGGKELPSAHISSRSFAGANPYEIDVCI